MKNEFEGLKHTINDGFNFAGLRTEFVELVTDAVKFGTETVTDYLTEFGKAILAKVEPNEQHTSYPGRLHGGLVAAVAHEAMTHAANLLLYLDPNKHATMSELTTKFRNATPVGQELGFHATVVKDEGEYLVAECRLPLDDSTICAEAIGRLRILPRDKELSDMQEKKYIRNTKYTPIGFQVSSKDDFVCGVENDIGLKAKFIECVKHEATDENDVDEENVLLGVYSPNKKHTTQHGDMYDGVAIAMLDETIIRAAHMQIDTSVKCAVTTELGIKFMHPVPSNQKLYTDAKIKKSKGRVVVTAARLFLESGLVCAEAAGKSMVLEREKVFDNEKHGNKWLAVDEKLPDIIEM